MNLGEITYFGHTTNNHMPLRPHSLVETNSCGSSTFRQNNGFFLLSKNYSGVSKKYQIHVET